MKVIYGLENFIPIKESVATIGVFDGVHLGHQQIITLTVEKARQLGVRSVVITFDRHPLEVIKPGKHPLLLTSLPVKIGLIRKLGTDILLVIEFTKKISQLTAEEFCETVLMNLLGIKEIIVGKDFQFGRGGKGDINFLKRFGEKNKFKVTGVPHIKINGEIIRSTLIREALKKGKIEKALEMCGRYPSLHGIVVKGDVRGHKLGFPTANIKIMENILLPRDGVYAGIANIDGHWRKCAINVGFNPTFNITERRIEIHIIDFSQNIYNKAIEIEFFRFLRGEIKFSSASELSFQIKKDILKAKELLKNK